MKNLQMTFQVQSSISLICHYGNIKALRIVGSVASLWVLISVCKLIRCLKVSWLVGLSVLVGYSIGHIFFKMAVRYRSTCLQKGLTSGMHWSVWVTAIHRQPRRRAHQRERRHRAHRGRQRWVLEGKAHPAATVGAVGAGPALALVALDGALEVVGVAKVVDLALQRVQVLGVPEKDEIII